MPIKCLVPGREFISVFCRGLPLSYESGFIGFIEALQEMSRSWRDRTQEGECNIPLTVNAEKEPPWKRGE
jgi:hypothetical protein